MEIVKSIITTRMTEALGRAVAESLKGAETDENGPEEAEKIEREWHGAESPNPAARSNK